MISRRKEIFFVALCVVFSALFTIGCSDSLLHPAQDGTRILVQLENSSSRSGDTPPPTEKWQGSAWIESRDGSESHHQKISSETDELSITFENIVIGSEIRIHLDVTSSSETAKRYKGSSNWKKIIDGVNVIVIVLKEVEVQEGDEPGQENPPSQETPTDADVPAIQEMSSVETSDSQERLEVTASVADGGDLTYQWYSNTSLSNKGGTKIEGATEADYTATVPAGETRYFYCVVKNTNEAATGNKTATATSNAVAVTNSSTSGTTTPDAGVVSGELGSQTNPVTTWAELAKAVADTATSTIYVKATTMTAESGITFNGDKEIIPLQDLNITVALASVPDGVFPGLFFIQPDSNISLGDDNYTITLNDNNMNNCAGGLIWSEGTLSMTNVVAENFVNGNGLLYSTGTSILNNVSLSGSWQSGTTDIIIGSSDSGENTLEIGQDVAISEVGFVVEEDAPCQPRIQLNANSSLKVDSPKIKINVTYFADATQTTSPPDGLEIVSVGDYAGDPNGLFEVVGNDGAIYTLDSEGRLVAADDSTGQENPPSQEPGTTTPEGELGSQTNPVTTWADLENIIEDTTGTALTEIYISAGDSGEAMDATSTITVVRSVEIIAATSTTINRAAAHTGLLFESADALTFTGSANAPIIFDGNPFDGNSIKANASIISAEADLTMTYCTMQNNVNTSNSGGGAILVNSGTLTLDNCHFSGNTSNSGG